MKILVTGASGLLGPYLVGALVENHTVIPFPHRDDCDITNPEHVKQMLKYGADAVIHAAALTGVDECEEDALEAVKVNRGGTYNLATMINPEAKFVYISTDMVYGDSNGPHSEPDVYPLNVYAKSKLAGEACARALPNHLILRTNFFGESKSRKLSFSDKVIDSLTNGRTAIFFNDVWFSPLHMETLSALIVELLEANVIGTYNLGSKDGMSKAQFAQAVAAQKGIVFNAAIGPSHFKVRRPKDMRMNVSLIETVGWKMPTLQEEIEKL